MPQTYRDLLWSILPAFLRGEYGQRLILGGLGLQADALADAAELAIRSSWILDDACGDDALQRIGESRRLPRYPGESTASYRSRLYLAWTAYAAAGSQRAIETQLEGFGLLPETKSHAIDTWARGTAILAPAPGFEDASGGTQAVRLERAGSGVFYTDTITDLCDLSAGGYSRTCAFEVCAKAGTATGLVFQIQGDVHGGSGVLCERFDLTTGTLDAAYLGRSGSPVAIIRPISGAPGWRRYRLAFAATGPNVSASIGLDAIGDTVYVDQRGLYLGPELVTVWTPLDWDRGEATHPTTGEEWWSRFWVFISHGVHAGTLTAEQKSAIVQIVRKWKDSHWALDGVVLDGTAPTCGYGLVCGEGAVVGGTAPEVLT